MRTNAERCIAGLRAGCAALEVRRREELAHPLPDHGRLLRLRREERRLRQAMARLADGHAGGGPPNGARRPS